MREIKDLDELKAIELNIMKAIHEFCKKNGIWYVLTYGTLLGAIRHNGFIPWDDDIDIHMTREGYNTFQALFPTWGKERGLSIVSSHTNGNEFPRDILKVCDDRTLLKEKSYKNECNLGVFVDIWPLDKVPLTPTLTDKLWMNNINIVKRLSLASDIKHESEVYRNLSAKKRAFISFFGVFNSKKLALIQEKLSQKNNNLKNAQYTCFQANKRFYEEKDIFPAVLHTFEDAEFYVPNNYDEILRRTYGNYMDLPPVEQRKPHHIQNVYWR